MTKRNILMGKGAFGGLLCGLAVAAMIAALPVTTAQAQNWECEQSSSLRLPPPIVVNFDLDRTEIKPEFQPKLVEFALRHRGNPNLRICVVGQADKEGNAQYNEGLALRRAQAVREFLANNGLPYDQMQIENRGEAFGDLFGWLGQSETDRRVEVVIVRIAAGTTN